MKWRWPYLPIIAYERVLNDVHGVLSVRDLAAQISSWGHVQVHVVSDDLLRFDVKPWSHSRTHFLAMIDAGRLSIEHQSSGVVVVRMDLSLGKMMLLILAMSLLVGLSSWNLGFAILVVAWLGGVNWAIASFKCRKRFNALFERRYDEN